MSPSSDCFTFRPYCYKGLSLMITYLFFDTTLSNNLISRP